jgi:Fe-S cluster assembly protein SufD
LSVWSEKLKQKAEARFQDVPLPSAKNENFRFTSLEEIPALLTAPSKAKGKTPALLSEKSDEEKAFLLLADKVTGKRLNTKSVRFTDLKSAVKDEEKLLKKTFSSTNELSDDKFALLAQSRWENGGFVLVKKNQKADTPLRITHWVPEGDGLHAFRTVIVLEDGAEATVVEEIAGSERSQRIVTGLIEAKLGRGAKLKYVQIQRLGKNTEFFLRQDFACTADAQVKVVPIYSGGKKGQVRHDGRLLGKGSHIEVKGAAYGSADQHFDFWLNAIHSVENTSSSLDFWFVMNDRARAVFNGLLDIKKTGIQTNAYQKSRSLLLSSKATVHAIPKLLIATDQVQCSHGASVSTLNPEQVHYLQSRGISQSEAERMIVRGFTQPVLDEIPIEAVYERIADDFSSESEVLQ